MKVFIYITAGVIALLFVAVAGALIVGYPTLRSGNPKPALTNKIEGDYSDLPAIQRWTARDGTSLAYRMYNSENKGRTGSIVLVPGSSQSSVDMHLLAKSLVRLDRAVYTIDVRGHGESGTKGQIDYIGQLEDDLVDFVGSVRPPQPRALMGFSASGGFALRFAGTESQTLFDHYILLAPTMSVKLKPSVYKFTGSGNDGGWVGIGYPRLMVLTMLNRFGVHFLNRLAVAAFRLPERAKSTHTDIYSFALFTNFGPSYDYENNIRAIHQPVSIIAGGEDELIDTARYQSIFSSLGCPASVVIISGQGHLGLLSSSETISAIQKELAKDAHE